MITLMKIKLSISKIAAYSRSSIQNINNRRFRIWKNKLLNLIENQPDIDKIYLHVKYLYEAKYQYLSNIRDKVGIKNFNDPKAFIEHLNDMYEYKTIIEYNPDKERKILIAFDDMIVDMINNRKAKFNSN